MVYSWGHGDAGQLGLGDANHRNVPTAVPGLPGLEDYIALGCIPGGTERNFDAVGGCLPPLSSRDKAVLCDPQTSGGLLVALAPAALDEVQALLIAQQTPHTVIGSFVSSGSGKPAIHLKP